MYKAMIFDLDGTLLDTVRTIAYYGNKTLENFGFDTIETEKYKFLAGRGARNLVKGMLAEIGATDKVDFEEVYEYYNREYNKKTLHLTEVFEGINELLSAAKAKGIKLSVLSNKPHTATVDVLSRFFGNDMFDLVTGAKDGVPLKPDPTAAIMIKEQLGISEEECIYVGDTDVDMQTGKNAGFYTVGVLWGFRGKEELVDNGADAIVSHPSELLDIL